MDFPGGSDGKGSACNVGDPGSIPGSKRSLEKGMEPTPVFLPGEFHGQRSLACYSPLGSAELDTSERLMLYYKYCARKEAKVNSENSSSHSESTCKSFSLSHTCMYTHIRRYVSYSLWESLMLNSSFFVGKAEAWGMKQLSLTFGAQVQICFCTTLGSMLVLGAMLAWGSLKKELFKKQVMDEGGRWDA